MTRRRQKHFGGALACAVAASTLAIAPTAAAASFADVSPSHRFFTEITWLADNHITSGYPDGTFRGSTAVSRQAMAAFLHRYVHESHAVPPVPYPGFSDVGWGHPFGEEIAWLEESGITSGYPDGTFRGSNPVSRQAMAAFLYRLDGEPGFVSPSVPSFPDVPPTHPLFAEIEWLASTGIAGGYDDGTFRGSTAVSRQAMAAFLYRYDSATGVHCEPNSEPQSECDALVALYSAMGGPGWADDSGWLTESDPCTWYGVVCGTRGITRVNLSTNELSGQLPPDIADLPNLVSLHLDRNRLTSVAPELGDLSSLAVLSLALTPLTSVPASIGELSSLRSLDLGNSDLSSLPPEVGSLSKLRYLTLRGNDLSTLPPEVGDLASLTYLDLGFSGITALPAEVGNLSNLAFLNANFNGLTALPPEVGELSSLRNLHLAFNELVSLPAGLWGLAELTFLDLAGNELSHLPAEIANLEQLTHLDLFGNDLASVPPELGDLSNLTNLSLSSNELISLPPEIGQLSSLISLNLDFNRLRSLPPEIGSLASLKFLLLDGNELSQGVLPEQMLELEDTLIGLLISANGCLTAETVELAAWLESIAPEWDSDCAAA